MLTEGYKLCDACRRNSNLKGIYILGYYNDEVLKKAIWEFKYNFVKDIGEILALLAAKSLKEKADFNKGTFAAVPLDKKRLAWRGFNQSEILAFALAKNLEGPFLKNALKRVRKTKSQIGLSKKERVENVLEAFKVNGAIPDGKIFLVDDVFTTGSTLEECAKELKKAGAKEVWGVVLAKD